MMIAEGFTCQRYGFNVGADKFSLLTIENGKTSIMRLSEWTLISQSQKSHSDRLLEKILERPVDNGFLQNWEVDSYVNDISHEGSFCAEPVNLF